MSAPSTDLTTATAAQFHAGDPHAHAHEHDHSHDDHLEPITVGEQIVNVLGIFLPFAGLVLAIVLLWGWGFTWLHAALLGGMYLITAVGVTVGYHRYFTHRSFRTNRVVQAMLGIFGSMALEGSILKWTAMHRCHHQHSDKELDPHSPHHHGSGFWGVLRGMFHAHVGWIFIGDPKNLSRYVPDLHADRMIRILSKLWTVWALIGLLLPALIGGLVTMSWTGAFLGLLWGGLARVFLVHHVTWSVNSVCHMWGSRPYKSHDHSRNNFVVGVLGLGEGWHNNHHAFPTSARHGLKWWQIDISWWIIKTMEKLGLAWDVKVPDATILARKAPGAAS